MTLASLRGLAVLSNAVLPKRLTDGGDLSLLTVLFINAAIVKRFELIMSEWVNESTFVKSVRGRDGANPVNNISGQDVLLGVTTLRRLVRAARAAHRQRAGQQPTPGRIRAVRHHAGHAYCYLPSITALRFISTSSRTIKHTT